MLTPRTKVRLTLLAGVVIGALLMFLVLVGQDAQAPQKEFVRLIDAVDYDDLLMPCPDELLTVRECRALVRKGG